MTTQLAAGQPEPIQLTGAPNFRDIGGLTTADGRTVKTGLLYRSGQLSALAEADQAKLGALGIKAVFDLRSEGERGSAPTHWSDAAHHPEIIDVPMSFGSMPANLPLAEMMRQFAEKVHSEGDARALMSTGMAELTESGREQIAKVLVRLSNGSEPAIVHCTAGKDRTGLVTAVLLTILGVPRDQVMADYLRSNAAMRSAAALPPGMKLPMDPKLLRPLMLVEPGYLEASFQQIDKSYGSFENYRRSGLHITDQQAAKLKSIFLQ